MTVHYPTAIIVEGPLAAALGADDFAALALFGQNALPSSWGPLVSSGEHDFLLRVPVALSAIGLGSAGVTGGVRARPGARWLSGATAITEPEESVALRLVVASDPLRDQEALTGTYFELGNGDQSISVGYNAQGQLLVSFGEPAASFAVALPDGPLLIDLFVDLVTAAVRLFVNGVWFWRAVPALVSLDPFGAAAQVAVQNNIAGTNSADGSTLSFVGLQLDGEGVALEEHVATAIALGVRYDGLLDFGVTPHWAWSGPYVDKGARRGTLPILPGEPNYGADGARLTPSPADPELIDFDTDSTMFDASGLGRTRLTRGISGGALARVSPSGFPAVDDDLAVRLVVAPAAGLNELFTLGSYEIVLDGAELTLTAPDGYVETVTLSDAPGSPMLIDAICVLDNGGGVSQWTLYVNGSSYAVPAADGVVSSLDAGAAITLLPDAPEAVLAYAAVGLGADAIPTLAIHRALADALEV